MRQISPGLRAAPHNRIVVQSVYREPRYMDEFLAEMENNFFNIQCNECHNQNMQCSLIEYPAYICIKYIKYFIYIY